MCTGFKNVSLSTATVTTLEFECLAAAMAAARSIWDMMNPPKMSRCIFSCIGMARVRVARYPPGGESDFTSAIEEAGGDEEDEEVENERAVGAFRGTWETAGIARDAHEAEASCDAAN